MADEVSETPPVENGFDNPQIVSMITLMRIYDTLLAIYTHQDPEGAKDLMEMHANGHLLAPSPVLSGIFITDEVLREETDK